MFLFSFTVCSRSVIRLLPRLIHGLSALPQDNEDGRIAKDENYEGDDGRQYQVGPDLVVVGVRDVAGPVGLVCFDVGLVVMLNEQKYIEMVIVNSINERYPSKSNSSENCKFCY